MDRLQGNVIYYCAQETANDAEIWELHYKQTTKDPRPFPTDLGICLRTAAAIDTAD